MHPLHPMLLACSGFLLMSMSFPATAGDWPMWGGTASRNMVSTEKDAPTEWDVQTGRNIKWAAPLGSISLGTPIVSGGVVYVGTNNERHFDPAVGMGDGNVEAAFDEASGKFLWQKFYPKLLTGRHNDWPGDGMCAPPYCEPGRLWHCTNTGHVICFDTSAGARKLPDGSPPVIWDFDMIGRLGVFPYKRMPCSPVAYKDKLYVITNNGVSRDHRRVEHPLAPSLICFDKNTGKIIWTDNSPGKNILCGQWSSPCIAEVGGKTLIIAGLGDAWIYAYEPDSGKVVWKFDCNDKDAVYPQTRSEIVATPVVVGERLYIAVGNDQEYTSPHGRLWCIDIAKTGDISAELDDLNPPAGAPGRFDGRKGISNPNSGVIWQALVFDANHNGKIDRDERVYGSRSTVAVSDGLVFLPDIEGYFHCFDAKTGQHLWTYDLESAVYGSPLVVDGKVYVGDEDGDVCIFKCAREMHLIAKREMGANIKASPVFANGTLYVMTREKLFAISQGNKAN